MNGVRYAIEPVVEDGALALGQGLRREKGEGVERRDDPPQDDGVPELFIHLEAAPRLARRHILLPRHP